MEKNLIVVTVLAIGVIVVVLFLAAPVRKSKPRIPIRNPESEDIDHETVNGNKNNSKPNSTDDNNNSIIIKVIGGTDARIQEFPWQISLQLRNAISGDVGPICGGAILDRNKVITAAHCINEETATQLEVVAGTVNIYNPDGNEQRIVVSEAKYHNDFDPDTYDNDIALLTLSSNLSYNSKVRPIRIIPNGVEPSGSCLNTGWGNTRNDVVNGVFPEILQKITLQIIRRDICNISYEGVNVITNGMICAESDNLDEKGSCKGDSGGPLVCEDTNGKYLAGIVSWGVQPCADRNYPSVFTNVAYFKDWINEQL